MKYVNFSFKNFTTFKVNKVIKFLIFSDVFIIGSVAMLGPIFALFIEDFIITDDPELVAGTSMGVFLFFKSLFSFPVARFLDETVGERDEFYSLFIFSILMSLTPLFYFVVRLPIQLYIVQALLGIFTTFTYPSYNSIFTKHLDKKEESTEWGIYFTLTDLSSALFAILGGVLSSKFGFYYTITTVCAVSIVGSLVLLPLRKYLYINRKI